ncbi:MAG TPA: thioredoxin domain-containing protein [Candidatus Saccharimonadales bacterium]|nr:thioredoxin domain-containing protein [Candidatus Saccharimonadales bacterium]
MDKRFWAIIGVIVVIFGGILIFHDNKSNTGGASGGGTPTNHVEGNLSSKVTLVEYGDYQCPVCEGYFTTVQQVQQKYNDRIKFQFRNLPLISAHPNALAGARAAEAADMQGKFWQMHDLLYDSQNYNEWAYDPAANGIRSTDPTPFFKQYAAQLGLNVAKFQSDFASSAANNRVQADIAAFAKTGQEEATPSFFINGTYISNTKLVDSTGSPSLDAFSKVIDTALKNNQ